MKIPGIRIPLVAAAVVTLLSRRIEYFVPREASSMARPYGLSASNVLFIFLIALLSVWLFAFFYNNRRSGKI